MKKLIDLETNEALALARDIDKQSFISLSNAFNKDVGIKYGLFMRPEDIETVVRKGLAFDKVVEEKGYDAVYGIKTHFAIEREKMKEDLELYKKAFEIMTDNNHTLYIARGRGKSITTENVRKVILDQARRELESEEQ